MPKPDTLNDWWACNGEGGCDHAGPPPAAPHADDLASRPSPLALRGSRRNLLAGGLLGGLAWAAGAKSALSDLIVRPRPEEGGDHVCVVIFLRGAADGLNVVVPYAEDDYHKARPTLALANPSDRRKEPGGRTLDLDGFFGLHPALSPLLPLYRDGSFAMVHAIGSGDQTRSHFEAMTAMERGQRAPGPGVSSGWIARHLGVTPRESSSPLRAVAFSNVLPDSLRGATDATALQSLDDYRLRIPAAMKGQSAPLQSAIQRLYAEDKDAVSLAGSETLSVLNSLRRMDPAHYKPARGARYPETPLGAGLRQVACLVKGRVGLEIACLDRGGWDTHVAQGTVGGWLAMLLDDVGKSLAAFAADMGPEMRRTTLVMMTEFGRRVQENSGLGTDHGRASVMFLLGGGVAGGKVYAKWPGLKPEQREPPGDLRVTTDYRNVLAELLHRRMGNPHLDAVFPGFTPDYPGIIG